jgi:hypothetical protein
MTKQNLEQQTEDWNNLVTLMQTTREAPKEVRTLMVNKFYNEVLKYLKKYHTKFDPLNEPE